MTRSNPIVGGTTVPVPRPGEGRRDGDFLPKLTERRETSFPWWRSDSQKSFLGGDVTSSVLEDNTYSSVFVGRDFSRLQNENEVKDW